MNNAILNLSHAAAVRVVIYRVLAGILLVAGSLSAAYGAEAPAAAIRVVEELEQALLDSMKAGAEKSFIERREELAPVVDKSLDYTRMGRFIFGSQWIEFSDTDRKAFVQAFRKLSSANYAARFDHYQGESFVYKTSDAQGGTRARIRSEFIKKNGEPIIFDYLLTKTMEGWRIVNIIVEGVSDLALKRTQYSGVFKSLGMSGVIETMANQEQQLENE